MRVMIVEDDPSTGALLLQLVRRVWPAAAATLLPDGESALEHWRDHGADLVLLDWGLPGIGGLAVLEQIRKASAKVLCVVVSGRADRQVVLDARKHNVDAYIVKPFSARQVMARLAELVANADAPPPEIPPPVFDTPDAFVESELNGNALSMPLARGLAGALEGLRGLETEERMRILRQCQIEPALVTRLLGIGNGGPYNSDSRTRESFESALHLVGLDILINLAMELDLHPGSVLEDETLLTWDRRLRRDCLGLIEILTKLQRHAEFDLPACRAAAMLYRGGEFVLLQLLQRWVDQGQPLAPDDCERILSRHANTAGQRIKMQWGVPNGIRLRAGAAWLLPVGTVRTDAIAMRIAGLLIAGERTPEIRHEIQRLLSRIGVPETHWDEYLTPAAADAD